MGLASLTKNMGTMLVECAGRKLGEPVLRHNANFTGAEGVRCK